MLETEHELTGERKPGGLSLGWRWHHTCVSFTTAGAPPGSQGKDDRKIPSCFQNGEGKNNRFIISPEHLVPLNKSSSLRKLLYQNLTKWGKGNTTPAFPNSDMGEENYPTPVLSSLPVSPKGKNKALEKITAQGHRLT